MSKYKAKAVKGGGFGSSRPWVVHVEGVGTTQGANEQEAEEMAKDLVSIMLDVPVSEVEVDIEFER